MKQACTPSPRDVTERLRRLRDALCTDLIERDDAVRLALLGCLAGEHLLLIGPPGTAKSLIARTLQRALTKPVYFERLLTRFTVPEELFGPLSIKGLEEDRYERLTTGYLPKASIAFLDEIFKANSAILNALLTLLNEREFDNGARREQTPLIAVIGASNELPEGEELDALYDRFLLRLHVGPVSTGGFTALLRLRGAPAPAPAEADRLSADDITAVQKAAQKVMVPTDVEALLVELRGWCAAEGIVVSDRRWRKIVKLLQVSAWSNGHNSVSVWDCWLLQHCLWQDPEQRQAVADWYEARVGSSAAMDPSRLTRIVAAWEGRLKRDKNDRSQRLDAKGRRQYLNGNGRTVRTKKGRKQAERDGELLFLCPDGATTNQQYNYAKGGDRTNAERGYTVDELRALYLDDGSYHGTRFRDWSKSDAYLAEASNRLMEEIDWPPLMEPTRHKRPYVDDCLAQVAVVQKDVETYQTQLQGHIASLKERIANHLWVPTTFAEPAHHDRASEPDAWDCLDELVDEEAYSQEWAG